MGRLAAGEDTAGTTGPNLESPARRVEKPVVLRADGEEIVEVTLAAPDPLVEVVDLAELEGDVAPLDGARVVNGAERRPLGGGREALVATHVEWL